MSDAEPDSDAEDLSPADDANATEAELNGAVRDRQPSYYSLRARIDAPERLH